LEQTTYNLKRIQRGVSGSTTIVAALSGLVKGPFVSNGKCFYVRRQYPGPAEIYEITGATSTKIAESDSYLNEYDNQFNFTTPVINHSTGIYFPVNGGMNRIVSGVVEQVPINQLWVFNLSGYFVPFSSLSGDSVFLMGSNDSVYALSQDATSFEQIGFPGQFGTAYGSQCAFSTDNGLLYGGQDSTIQVWEKPYPWEA
jgi:hypothetical protein